MPRYRTEQASKTTWFIKSGREKVGHLRFTDEGTFVGQVTLPGGHRGELHHERRIRQLGVAFDELMRSAADVRARANGFEDRDAEIADNNRRVNERAAELRAQGVPVRIRRRRVI